MRLLMRMAVTAALTVAVTGCIGPSDPILTVVVRNEDTADYLIVAAERGMEDVPVGYRLGAGGFWTRSGGWQGVVQLMAPDTCRVLDELAVEDLYMVLIVREDGVFDVATRGASGEGLAELQSVSSPCF